jgi:hypothetical protein
MLLGLGLLIDLSLIKSLLAFITQYILITFRTSVHDVLLTIQTMLA